MPGKIDAVGFLIKSMVERDPSKRRVKPSQQALQEFEGLQLEDSSDDSDYKVDEKEDDDDDDVDSNFSGDDIDDDKEENDSRSEESSDEAEGEQEGEVTVAELLKKAEQNGQTGAAAPVKLIKVCCICLGDRSSDQNELVECDSCHVVVHEGCNGISESHSTASSGSSDPCEPWFCDACRAGATRFECDLCPNTGGLLKETDTGRWVHLVCALYVPGVAFGDVDRLTAVTLFEIPYTRWGGKACSECEDPSLARTGVTVQCDAGMCKAAFHVTCAQQRGLLQEARADDQAADPYFANCKLHTDRTLIRERRRNFLAMRLYQRQEHPQKMQPSRLKRKLARLQAKYRAQRDSRKPKWTPTMKLPRPLTSSVFLLRALQRRAARLGTDLTLGQHAAAAPADVSRRWHLPPAFSVEFISYFLERGQRAAAMTRSLQQLMSEKAALQLQEDRLRLQYAETEASLSQLRSAADQLRSDALQLHQQLAAAAGERPRLPRLLQQPVRGRQPSGGRAALSRLSPNKQGPRGGGGRLTLHECVECGRSGDQHLLALCDTCQNHYHLACLDPPLTRMPRKSKTAGWQCWRCAAGSRRPSLEPADTQAPRRLRRPATAAAQVTLKYAEEHAEPLRDRRGRGRPPKRPAAPRPDRKFTRKDVKNPGVGRGNWRRFRKQQQESAGADAAVAVPAAKSDPTCQSVVMIEKLDQKIVAQQQRSPSPKRRRVDSGPGPSGTAVSRAGPGSSGTADTTGPASGGTAVSPADPGSGGTADTPTDPGCGGTAIPAAPGSGDTASSPSGRPSRLRSIDDTINDILEQVAGDPNGGPPTPPPFVYGGRGRPPTMEPRKPYVRRPGRPRKFSVETPGSGQASPSVPPPPAVGITKRKPEALRRRRRTKSEIDALNAFLERKRAERRAKSSEAAAGAEPSQDSAGQGDSAAASQSSTDVSAAGSGANTAAAAPSAGAGAASTVAAPAVRGRRGRPSLSPGRGRGRGRGRPRLKPGRPPLQRSVSAPTSGAGPEQKPRRRRRTKAELREAALMSQLSVPADGAQEAELAPLQQPPPGDAAPPDAAAPAASGGRPVRSRRTKAEMTLYREQVLALKQARQRHQAARQKLLRQKRRRDEGREHVVEVMTPMKIKIRPVPLEQQQSEAASAGGATVAGPSSPPRDTPAAAGELCASCERSDTAPRVSCDDCGRGFHLNCLVPPVSKSPKRPGYGWLCGHCSAVRPAPDKEPEPQPESQPESPTPQPEAAPAPEAEVQKERVETPAAEVKAEPEPETAQ